MATALLWRSSIRYNAGCFKFPTSWCLSELLTPHFPIENGIRRVSNGVSFYSQLATGVGLPSFMRGAVLWESGKPLSMEEFHIPRPKAGEILVITKGCGVCHSDLHIIKGEVPYFSPCVLGHEITGEVVEHGPLRDDKTKQRLPIGSRDIARAFGASEIIAVDVLDEKLEKAKAFVATHTVNAAREDPVGKIIEITCGKGVDVAVEALGKPQTFSQCTQSVKDGGKAVIIGLVQAGAVGQVDINRLVRRKIKVIGSHGGRARQDLPELVRLAETGIFNLSNTVSRRYNFEEAGKVFEDLNMGKIVRRAVIEIR